MLFGCFFLIEHIFISHYSLSNLKKVEQDLLFTLHFDFQKRIYKVLSFLKHLQITQLRNLTSVSIELSPEINLFYGENGSGKTSILEAISLLGLGRSFRSHKPSSLINYQSNELTVFAKLITPTSILPIGVQKRRNGNSSIRISGKTVHSAAILARQLPLLFINAESFQLIEGSPKKRRQFLDWVTFHVKPEFSQQWKNFEKILRQRNSLLRRDKISYVDIQPWDVEFCHLANKIDLSRKQVAQDFIHQFSLLLEENQGKRSDNNWSVTMEYCRGWDSNQDFSQLLKNNFERDLRDGYTHYGPQRADIKIRSKQKPAIDVLSRGQKKSLICSMAITQARLYQAFFQRNCIFLIDDLLEELDEKHIKMLTTDLIKLNAQVFITGISQKDMLDAWKGSKDANIKMFHMKHGGIESEASNLV